MRPAFCSEVNSVSSASVHTFTGCVIGCRHAAGLNGLPLARFAAALSHPPAPRSRGSLLAPERSMLAFLHRARPLIGLSAIGVLIAVPGWQPAKRKDANPTYRRSSSPGPNRDARCSAPGDRRRSAERGCRRPFSRHYTRADICQDPITDGPLCRRSCPLYGAQRSALAPTSFRLVHGVVKHQVMRILHCLSPCLRQPSAPRPSIRRQVSEPLPPEGGLPIGES